MSFMTSDEPSYGCRSDNAAVKKHFAEISLKEKQVRIDAKIATT